MTDQTDAVTLLKALVDGWDVTAPHVTDIILTQHARTGVAYDGPPDFAEAMDEARRFLASPTGHGSSPCETDRLLETAHKVAGRMGAVFVEDPEKIAAFRRSEGVVTPQEHVSCPTCGNTWPDGYFCSDSFHIIAPRPQDGNER